MVTDRGKEQRHELGEFAKGEAARLGFSLVGITSPEPPPHLDVYRRWLDEGRHGDMAYLATERARSRRADPREILPECKSILVLAVNYLPQQPAQSGIAAYAVGDDYHDVLESRVRQLVTRLEERLGRKIENRYYTDTGPLLERELAQRAGLGWIGKNTCLISPLHGSYFFLTELLLDVQLEVDEPIKTDHCGECTLCIEACPTECILPDRTLDATRCISYLTIENKGRIPQELRARTGEWVFGCDICQQVCPWNIRFAEPTIDIEFQTRSFLQNPLPRDFIQMSESDYQRELSKSTLKRAKRAGLLRNAALAAANSKDHSCIPDLVKLLSEETDAIPRVHAAWALGQLGAIDALQDALAIELDPEVVVEIRTALKTATDRA